MVNSLQPKPVHFLDSFVITHVSAGWNHSGFVSDNGCLFTCGDGSFGQLGHGDHRSHCTPSKVLFFGSSHVKQTACGMRHSLALLKDSFGDQVYGFGSGKRGQLGISNDKIKSISLPQTTSGLKDVNVATIYANGDHSAALSVDGHLYTWGRGFKGSDACCPHGAIGSLFCKQAAFGWNHALVLTGEGEVLMLGGSNHGVLSNPQKMNLVKHKPSKTEESNEDRIPGLDGISVVDIAAGAEHSALVTEDGAIMTWGWGEHGQLGLGNAADQTSPQVVSVGLKLAKELATSKVYCGSGFTYVTRTKRHPSQT